LVSYAITLILTQSVRAIAARSRACLTSGSDQRPSRSPINALK